MTSWLNIESEYTTMQSGDICSDENTWQMTSFYNCCLRSLSLDTYILIWSTLLSLSIMYYGQSLLSDISI